MPGMWKSCAIWLTGIALAAAGGLDEVPHPRLWFPQSAEAPLRKSLVNDPLAAKLQAAVMAQAQAILNERTCRHEIPDGKRLLSESRRALRNTMHSAWAWRISGEEKFRLRTIAELDAACGLKDWNPSHFLDTAEMATAVAVGYDWLYATLTPEQRAMCERAIIDKALKPAASVYQKGSWWSKPKNNWSQVCGAGIAIAAAAVAGKDEGMAEDLFDRGLRLVELCNAFYQPDGMYPEGPGYWHYGTNYHVMMLAACRPFGRRTVDAPALRKAGDAIMHLTSTTRLSYNFADGNASRETPSPAQCWLATHFRDTVQASHVRKLFTRALDEGKGRISGDRWFPLSVLWLPPPPKTNTPLPNAAVFHGEQSMAIFRNGWDPQHTWFAIKGGSPAINHAHMDVGSFAYDAHGIRWIHDLGPENYNLPAYFGKNRWNYYRLQNRSHNTLEIAGHLQNPNSKPCPLIASSQTTNPLTATFDLSDAYAGSADQVLRTARFDARRGTVRIEDQIAKPAGDVVWRAFTDAQAEVKNDQVILRKSGHQITLRRISPIGTWSIQDAKPPTPGEKQNQGFRAVVLTAPQAANVSLIVEIRSSNQES